MKKPTASTADQERRALCDIIVTRAAELMVEQSNAPAEMIIDRMITYCIAQTVAAFGRDQAIDMLKHASQRIEDGAFDHLKLNRVIN